MVDYDRVQDFLEAHDMEPERVDPKREAALMLEDMRRGLAGEKSDMPMIPTYLSNDAQLPLGRSVAVIDAGGTNFRSALVRFEEDGCHVSELSKCRMPGVGEPCTWEEFISFVADRIEPLMGRAESIGFCFSYSADITPDMDGRVIRIDKEVVVTGSEGKLIGASLKAELERRGITGKRVVILNDTVAVLLGGAAGLDKRAYSGFIGQVSGTGTNTCVSLPERLIGKLGSSEERGMIINMEAGLYTGIPRGSFDLMLDSASNNPGLKAFEKLTAGVYLGQLCRLMLIAAADEGLISRVAGEGARQLEDIDSAVIDAWSCMERGELLGGAETDLTFASRLSRALFKRSARGMCTDLLALAMLTGAGKSTDKPLCVLAEGSLVQKSRIYRPELERLLEEYGREAGVHFVLKVGQETTLPGAAAAALINHYFDMFLHGDNLCLSGSPARLPGNLYRPFSYPCCPLWSCAQGCPTASPSVLIIRWR